MLRKLLVLAAPLALVLLIEALFAAGAWDRFAEPHSHAGTSLRLKQALRDPAVGRIDYVTIGSSRPEYGIDHVLLAAEAQRLGRTHADLTMPGTHWTSAGVLVRWLEREHPEVRGGIIALSAQDLAFPYNGYYELGIAQPFRRVGDMRWIGARIPFSLHDVASYGVVSALFAWRDDVRAFVTAPTQRRERIEWQRAHRDAHDILFGNPESHGDMCSWGVEDLAACERLDAATGEDIAGLRRQCRELRARAADAPDFAAGRAAAVLPEFMANTRDLVRAQLEEMHWPVPPVVILMPMPRIWNEVLGRGQHDWAVAILQPLAEDGHIGRIVECGYYDVDADGGATAFFDFYHQNARGRERFTQWLLPRLRELLYQGGSDAPASIATKQDRIRP
jgi:hypothetical protein